MTALQRQRKPPGHADASCAESVNSGRPAACRRASRCVHACAHRKRARPLGRLPAASAHTCGQSLTLGLGFTPHVGFHRAGKHDEGSSRCRSEDCDGSSSEVSGCGSVCALAPSFCATTQHLTCCQISEEATMTTPPLKDPFVEIPAGCHEPPDLYSGQSSLPLSVRTPCLGRECR